MTVDDLLKRIESFSPEKLEKLSKGLEYDIQTSQKPVTDKVRWQQALNVIKLEIARKNRNSQWQNFWGNFPNLDSMPELKSILQIAAVHRESLRVRGKNISADQQKFIGGYQNPFTTD